MSFKESKNTRYFTSKDSVVTRRRFVKGLAAGGVVASGGLSLYSPHATSKPRNIRKHAPALRGKNFNLVISEHRVNFTGKTRIATAINGSVPAPTLYWQEGETVTITVTNHLSVKTSIHWHGMILPTHMDGVPGLSFNGIKPGESFTYQFKVQQHGTYWYHSHSGFQEQTGMHGVIVILPKKRDPFKFDRDYVIEMSDWSDEDPKRIYAKLKKLSHYYNFNERTLKTLMKEIKRDGFKQTWQSRKMWNQMRMSTKDLSDVTGYTYTYLMNGDTPQEGWKGLFKPGERIRLRLANTSAMTFFDVRIPGLKLKVVAADGQYVKPVWVDEIRIGVAESYDVIVKPTQNRAYSIFAQSIGRSGFARGSLTPNLAQIAPVPRMDPVPSLTHADMGMDMSSMGGMEDMKGMDHAAMGHSMPKPAMKKGMDHSKMSHDMSMVSKISHAKTEYGPHIDMLAVDPQYRLSDPGVGLRNNGRKVLTYADLQGLYPTLDRRKPSREIELHLTGNMARYIWSINGVKYANSQPIQLRYGERVRITLVNDTMMNHPMHLHGMWSEIETGNSRHLLKKHTVIVQPGSKISYLVTADARGRWAYHCHLLYHMSGMFREVKVS